MLPLGRGGSRQPVHVVDRIGADANDIPLRAGGFVNHLVTRQYREEPPCAGTSPQHRSSVTLVGVRSIAMPPDVTPERLTVLGRIWVTVKFAHPRVALTDRDWDRALVRRVAGGEGGYERRELCKRGQRHARNPRRSGDAGRASRTRAYPLRESPRSKRSGTGTDEALVLDLRAGGALTNSGTLNITVQANLQGLKHASKVVVDLRGVLVPAHAVAPAFAGFNDLLVSDPVAMPSSRAVLHSGYRAQAGGAGFYSSKQMVEAAALVRPREGAGEEERRLPRRSRVAHSAHRAGSAAERIGRDRHGRLRAADAGRRRRRSCSATDMPR